MWKMCVSQQISIQTWSQEELIGSGQQVFILQELTLEPLSQGWSQTCQAFALSRPILRQIPDLSVKI